ncbi:MAG: prepilin-type N-terminal cleavage/methylation domain-containing protein [Candidatus Omnitrophica bacterium]|nr:prepilin-type N-terminal cleavage/methylation domain-containing protein [Candidatus Omnitrophota bacterium]
MLKKRSFTLIELLIVIVIIGVLAALAFPGFSTSKERALDREARSSLGLIQAAEKIYKMESGFYYPPSGSTSVVSNINTYLKVSLPSAGISWTYTVNGPASQSTATRVGSGGRVWTLTNTGSTPTCSGSGCP